MNTSKTTINTSASAEGSRPSISTRARNGKIARLPLAIREQLNRRLDDGEPGKQLVAWLNSPPETQGVAKAAFAGVPVSEQNLSEWKQGGYRDWQRQRERRERVRQWTEEGKDLEGAAGGVMLSSTFTTILLEELAQAVEAMLEETTDAGTRLERLQEVARRFAQLRREESNAARVQVARERWDQEQAKEKKHERFCGSLTPMHTLLLQRNYINGFGWADEKPRAAAFHHAEALPDAEPSSAAA